MMEQVEHSDPISVTQTASHGVRLPATPIHLFGTEISGLRFRAEGAAMYWNIIFFLTIE
jgi:hypothetical protein